MKFEDFLAPWEIDDKGKKLETPVEVDPEKLKKYLWNLQQDKEKAVEDKKTAETVAAQLKDDIAGIQRTHENDEQRRERENKEREERYAAAEARELERRKVDVIAEAFEADGITAARARRLAKRVTSSDEKDWVDDAKELVEDGFRITDKTEDEQTDPPPDEKPLTARPVRRSDGRLPSGAVKTKPQSVADELDAAGIGTGSW